MFWLTGKNMQMHANHSPTYYQKQDRYIQLKYAKSHDRVYGTPVSFLGAGYRGVTEFKSLPGDQPSRLGFFVVILGLPRQIPG
jgi:hypothetical protein